MSNNVSEKQRKFNIVDALIIVLAILCLVAVLFRGHIRTLAGMTEETAKYSIVFKVSSISESSYEYFEREDDFWNKVYLDSPELELGVIDDVLGKEASVIYMNDENGNIIPVTCPQGTYVDVSGIISCKGLYKDDGCFYLAGSYVISPGDVLKVHTVGLDFSLTVIDIIDNGVF